jgi:pre-rRNA-processing protein IPI1
MGRLGKLRHAEKSKTKLKGAKLTKGDNVTKTDFKIRKIVIPEQLKERKVGEVLSSTKKINVKVFELTYCFFPCTYSNNSHF